MPDATVSIGDGALVPWSVGNGGFYESVIQAIADRYEIDLDTAWGDLTPEQQALFLHGTNGDKLYVQYRNRMGRRRSYTMAFEGIVESLQRRYRETDSAPQRERIEEYMSFRPCATCNGARLKPEVLAVTVGGRSIHDFTRMSVTRSLAFLDELGLTPTEELIGHRIVKEIRERLTFLDNVGVGYLQLDRAAKTLSGGEAQRLRLATQIGSQLVGVLYILDEPSIGLHQRDNDKLIGTLQRLKGLGNTVLVVEHDEQMMRTADWLVDMGPGAGEHGGYVVAEGKAEDVMRKPESVTGQFLSGTRQIAVPPRREEDRGHFTVRGAAMHNLKGIDVEFPVGKLVCVTGVSGSGKSTLVNEIVFKATANRVNRMRVRPGTHDDVEGLEVFDKVIDIDQKPIGRTPRSNPATYIDLFTHIRELYSLTPESKVRGYKPGRFSFNVRGGRCETCKGDGTIKIEMHFLPDVYVQCETCHGHRYNKETLEVRFKGKSIADVLEMSVEEALGFFAKIPKLRRRLQTLARRRARLRQARPAGDDALRRRGAAGQARGRALQGRDGLDALHPRRADHGAPLRRHREAARGAAAARGRGQHRARDRAQPRRDQAGRLGRRPRAGGRRGGRRADRGRHARGGGRGRRLLHGALSARGARATRRGRRGLSASVAERRARFRELHARDEIFVMPNPWDVGSARLLASLGFEALATTSAGFAWSLGRLDQNVTRDELVAHVAELTAATDLPLNVDSENCFPDDPGRCRRDSRAARGRRGGRLLAGGLRPGCASDRGLRAGGRAGRRRGRRSSRAPRAAGAHRKSREPPPWHPGSRRHDPPTRRVS